MLYEYNGWVIDVTPDFALGKFFARARLTRTSPGDETDTEMHVARDLAWFDSEDEAVRFGRQWATAWINEHCGSSTSTQPEPATLPKDFPAETPAK